MRKLTPEQAPPSLIFPTTPTGRSLSLNRYNVHWSPVHGWSSAAPVVPVQLNYKWVQDKKSIALTRASQIDGQIDDSRTVAVRQGNNDIGPVIGEERISPTQEDITSVWVLGRVLYSSFDRDSKLLSLLPIALVLPQSTPLINATS
ncbi:hypothetical protein TNCV_3778731 [Trichonephila clavipes]|nr:hypothetical protein TNCV_3778731 [Trichonephila clavipes]